VLAEKLIVPVLFPSGGSGKQTRLPFRGDTRVSLLVLGFASSITAEQIAVVSVHTTRLQFHLALDLKRV
jgi:hypothetical protein